MVRISSADPRGAAGPAGGRAPRPVRWIMLLAAAATAFPIGVTLLTQGGTSREAKPGLSDIQFAQTMVPHHAQGRALAALARTRATSPELRRLAVRLQASSGREIDQMRTWLREAGDPEPPLSSARPGSPEASAGGDVTDADMAELAQAAGADFDRMFVEVMRRHGDSAVRMATTELRDGRYPAARALARSILRETRAAMVALGALRPTDA